MNRKGMTLIELLVYMAIAALLLAPVIMLIQNSSLNMARNAVNTDLRISGRDILNIMYDDLRNTGFKLKTPNGDWDSVATFLSPTSSDSSSFRPTNGSGAFDTLTIRKGRLNKSDGKWAGYDTIGYHVSVDAINFIDTLIRTSAEFDTTATPVVTWKRQAIATNIEALQFQYSANLEPSSWEDDYDIDNPLELADKKAVKYIKISVVTVDKKKLASTKTTPTINVGDYSYDPLPAEQQYLREISEIVVPIPNNGLFPD